MPDHSAMLPLIFQGLVLGWSVAWPPGPINAEMVRRALTRGFWPAYALGLGACSGDFSWALAVSLGAGALAGVPGVQRVLGAVSLGLLLVLATTFLRAAWRSGAAMRRGEPLPEPRRLQSARGGYLLGLGLAVSSPWNIAFWFAVIGAQAGTARGIGGSLCVATGVVSGACLWGFVLCSAVRWGARFATPVWHLVTQGATGVLMLGFAARLALRLAHV
jgi:threonine/homoserine/homoserine lactone efflux protein